MLAGIPPYCCGCLPDCGLGLLHAARLAYQGMGAWHAATNTGTAWAAESDKAAVVIPVDLLCVTYASEPHQSDH